LVYHELGHCLDNYLRKDLTSVVIDDGNRFKIRQVAKYYYQIILGEFAACVHSAKIMDADLYRYDLNNTQTMIANQIKNLEPEKRKGQFGGSNLKRSLFSASGVFWFILVQYSKLIGSKMGNPNLSEIHLETWINAIPKASDLLYDLSEILSKLWSLYPELNGNSFERILETWKVLAFEYGYEFVENGNNDSVKLV